MPTPASAILPAVCPAFFMVQEGTSRDFEGPKDELIDDKVAPGPRDMCAKDKN